MNSLSAKQLDLDGREINVFYDTVTQERARKLAPLYTTNFYLSNAYEDNDKVKERGGRFDQTLRLWYLPPLAEIRPCLKFIHKEAFPLMKDYVFRPDPSRFKSAGNASNTPQSLPDLTERTPPDSLSSAEEEKLSSHYIKKNFHKCPHCHTPMDASDIEYIKLRCVDKSCGHSFCRICNSPWVPGHHNLQTCPNAAMRPKASESHPPTSDEEDGNDGLGNVQKRLVFGKGKSEGKDTKVRYSIFLFCLIQCFAHQPSYIATQRIRSLLLAGLQRTRHWNRIWTATKKTLSAKRAKLPILPIRTSPHRKELAPTTQTQTPTSSISKRMTSTFRSRATGTWI